MNEEDAVNPAEDGTTHINVYSKGKTALGQLLSNLSHTPFKHPRDGSFASVEGYWYWLGSGKEHNQLRRLYGSSAKSAGVKLPVVTLPTDVFHQGIHEAVRCKIAQNPELRELFMKSSLPFRHYFVFPGKKDVVVLQKKHDWQMDFLESLRSEYHAKYGKPDDSPS